MDTSRRHSVCGAGAEVAPAMLGGFRLALLLPGGDGRVDFLAGQALAAGLDS